MTERTPKERFRRSGFLGLWVGLALVLLCSLVQPYLDALALLSPGATEGSVFPARLLLLALAALAVLEMPLLLLALVLMSWRRYPPTQLNALHFFYALSPTIYGVIGTLLTGVLWWAPLMWLLGGVRLFSSLLAIDPERIPRRYRDKNEVARAAAPSLAGVRGFVLDMDGVLYRGRQVREGATTFIEHLVAQGVPFVCLTNNATRTSEMYEQKLRELGLPIRGDQVIGAAQAAAEWLASTTPGVRVLAVGTHGLSQALLAEGFTLVERPPADVVVVGLDPALTYDRLKQASLAIRGGARFIGTNPDKTFPAEEGLLPGNGAALAFLEAATGQSPHITGKPAIPMMQIALDHLGLAAEQVAMVGDRLETDIVGGQSVGMVTVLVLGGVTTRRDLDRSEIVPTLVVDDLGQLLSRWRADRG